MKIYCDSPIVTRDTTIDLLNKYTFYIFYSRHTEIQYVCTVLQMNRNSNKLKKCNKPPSLAFDCEFEFELASIAAKLHEETK